MRGRLPVSGGAFIALPSGPRCWARCRCRSRARVAPTTPYQRCCPRTSSGVRCLHRHYAWAGSWLCGRPARRAPRGGHRRSQLCCGTYRPDDRWTNGRAHTRPGLRRTRRGCTGARDSGHASGGPRATHAQPSLAFHSVGSGTRLAHALQRLGLCPCLPLRASASPSVAAPRSALKDSLRHKGSGP